MFFIINNKNREIRQELLCLLLNFKEKFDAGKSAIQKIFEDKH